MEKDHYIGLIIILGIVAIALFGGTKNAQKNGTVANTNSIAKTLEQKEVEEKALVAKQELEKNRSKYFGLVKIDYVYNSADPETEYIILGTPYDSKVIIPISGWSLKSASNIVTPIPKANILYFSGTNNIENDQVIVYPGDRVYILSGRSPIGQSFRTNKCSGYLAQFKTFTPYLSNNCPLARNEDLSSIPKRVENDNCFDLIDRFPNCRVQTENLPITYTQECTKFIAEKLNYNSCVNAHKNDADFYQEEWRLYLNRSTEMWTNSRYETIILYDDVGKIVDTYKVSY